MKTKEAQAPTLSSRARWTIKDMYEELGIDVEYWHVEKLQNKEVLRGYDFRELRKYRNVGIKTTQEVICWVWDIPYSNKKIEMPKQEQSPITYTEDDIDRIAKKLYELIEAAPK